MSSFFQRKFSEVSNLFPLLSFSLTASDLHPYAYAKVNIPCSSFAFSISIPGPATAFFYFPQPAAVRGVQR